LSAQAGFQGIAQLAPSALVATWLESRNLEMLPSEHVMSPLVHDEQILEVRGGYLEFLEIGLK